MQTNPDFLVVGGGIVGLAVAGEAKLRSPGASVVILEKEEDLACHSSGRNSGVLHAGFYYTADSLKAIRAADRWARDQVRTRLEALPQISHGVRT